MDRKRTFILADDDPLFDPELYSDREVAMVMRALASWHRDGEACPIDPKTDREARLAFVRIARDVKKNDARYREVSEKRKAAVEKRWARAAKSIQMYTNDTNVDDRIGKEVIGEDPSTLLSPTTDSNNVRPPVENSPAPSATRRWRCIASTPGSWHAGGATSSPGPERPGVTGERKETRKRKRSRPSM